MCSMPRNSWFLHKYYNFGVWALSFSLCPSSFFDDKAHRLFIWLCLQSPLPVTFNLRLFLDRLELLLIVFACISFTQLLPYKSTQMFGSIDFCREGRQQQIGIFAAELLSKVFFRFFAIFWIFYFELLFLKPNIWHSILIEIILLHTN